MSYAAAALSGSVCYSSVHGVFNQSEVMSVQSQSTTCVDMCVYLKVKTASSLCSEFSTSGKTEDFQFLLQKPGNCFFLCGVFFFPFFDSLLAPCSAWHLATGLRRAANVASQGALSSALPERERLKSCHRFFGFFSCVCDGLSAVLILSATLTSLVFQR